MKPWSYIVQTQTNEVFEWMLLAEEVDLMNSSLDRLVWMYFAVSKKPPQFTDGPWKLSVRQLRGSIQIESIELSDRKPYSYMRDACVRWAVNLEAKASVTLHEGNKQVVLRPQMLSPVPHLICSSRKSPAEGDKAH